MLKYLARYVDQVAFANSRLVRIDNGQVMFCSLDRRRQQWNAMPLPAAEFLRRFLQHVPPRGTHKVRYHGFLGITSSGQGLLSATFESWAAILQQSQVDELSVHILLRGIRQRLHDVIQ